MVASLPSTMSSCMSGVHSAHRIAFWGGDQMAWPLAWHWRKGGRSHFLILFGPQPGQLLWPAREMLPVTASTDFTFAAKLIGTGLRQWRVTDLTTQFSAHSWCHFTPSGNASADTPAPQLTASTKGACFEARRARQLGCRRTKDPPCFPGPVHELYLPGQVSPAGCHHPLPVGSQSFSA